MAFKRRPPADHSLDLLRTLLETPLASGDERRGPVALRSLETRRDPKPRRAAHTWFDTLLLRSSQVLLISALLVLGYWIVNVPMNNWLHKPGAPIVRASAALPRAEATHVSAARVAPTKAIMQAAIAAPDLARSAPQSDGTHPQRPSATPVAARPATPTTAPLAAQPVAADQAVVPPALAADVLPTAAPTQPAPLMPSPAMALLWPTITPVQLGTVSKPSPAPVQRQVAIAQSGAPAGSRAASALPSRLIIPALSLDAPIKEVFIVGGQWQVAQYAAGYLNGSGLPGVPGNLALDGHAGLYGAVFANLGALSPGDDIYVDAAGRRYRYRLRTSSTVWPSQADVLDSTETPTMTLITCTNWDTQRLVAQADFVDSGPALDG